MIIDCKTIAQNIKDKVKSEIEELNIKPKFLILQDGSNDASNVYVRNKIKACEYCGIEVIHKDITEMNTKDVISYINCVQDGYDAVMLQMPVRKELDSNRIINSIKPEKDVDGLTDINVGRLWSGQDGLFPCTALGVIEILKTIYDDLTGLDVCVIGRSNLVGKPVSALLQRENCTVTMCHSKSRDMFTRLRKANIVVSAIGKAKRFEYYNFDNGQTLIDVGINRDENGKLCGDIDTQQVEYKLNTNITPVPGGVGLLTVAMLMSNILKAYKLGEFND